MTGKKEEKESRELATRPQNRINLMRGFDSLFDDFRREFDDMFNVWWPLAPTRLRVGVPSIRYPSIDIVDKGDEYVLTADLPGMTKDQLNVQLTEKGIKISAQSQEDREETGENYVMKERSTTAFRRQLAFPEGVKPNKAEAEMKNGILTIKLPKKEPTPKPKVVKLDIKD
jgi:HSP20 family protein